MGQARAWLCHHASAHASDLERITPPKLHFEILTPRPIPMEAGTVIGYRLRLFGVPLRWQARLVRWQPYRIRGRTAARPPSRMGAYPFRAPLIGGSSELEVSPG